MGVDHPDTLKSMDILMQVLSRQGKYKEAGAMRRQTLARREKVLEPEHPDTLASMTNLVGVLRAHSEYNKEIPTHTQILALVCMSLLAYVFQRFQ